MGNVNYLDLVPQINEGLNWNKDENGIVTLEIKNTKLLSEVQRPELSQA